MIQAYKDLGSLFMTKGFMTFELENDRLLLVKLSSNEHQLLYVEKAKRLDFFGVYFFSVRSSCKLHYVTSARKNELIKSLFKHTDDVIDFYGFDIPTSDSLLEYAKKGLSML